MQIIEDPIVVKKVVVCLKNNGQMEIAREDKKLIKIDKRLGYHPEAHTHLFTLQDLDYKISLLRSHLKK